jgi:hypothetical protein
MSPVAGGTWSVRARVVALWTVIGSALYAAGACANPSAPPGGPQDKAPPLLMRVTPAIGDTSVRPKVVSLQFDEVISETPAGAPDLKALVFISPRSGDVNVAWNRTRIDIRPKDGFRDSTVYTITIRPGIQDLYNNKIDSITTVVFSTRGPIPATAIKGVLFDWPAGRGARNALVEALSAADTTVAYLGVTDSVGRFTLRHVPQGQYLVRGFIDRNNNRQLERTELWDTVRIPLRDSADVELYSFIHDTMPIRITEAAVQDSGRRMRLTFDKPLALEQPFSPTQFRLRTLPDSTPMANRVVIVRTRAQQLATDSIARQRVADSLAAARDTVPPDSAAIARRDSLAQVRVRDSVAAAEREALEARRQLQLRGGRPLPPVDSTPPPKLSRPVPGTELFILFDAPLPYATRVLIEAGGIITLNGIASDAVRPLLTPAAPDSTARGGTARPPGAGSR